MGAWSIDKIACPGPLHGGRMQELLSDGGQGEGIVSSQVKMLTVSVKVQ
jgi:hypothetical protein